MVSVLSNFSEALAEAVAIAGKGGVRVEARDRLPAGGIVWSSDGIIATSHHVVEREDDIKIGLADGRTVDATLLGRDPTTDVAVLRVSGSDLVPTRCPTSRAAPGL